LQAPVNTLTKAYSQAGANRKATVRFQSGRDAIRYQMLSA